ncbi:hypothetical protein JXD38_08790 [candidate division WOR-3 bacterium]|nr:hypothetical protein [candidate division WOR-3 bacterium]
MKKCCTAVVAVALLCVAFSVGNAAIAFYGVVDPNTRTVEVQTAHVFISTSAETIPTTGWIATGASYDTFQFPDIEQWPDSVELLSTINSLPNVTMFRAPVENTFYDFEYGGITRPKALFYSGMANVEEPPSAAEPRQRLSVSPSVVTGQMSIRVQPAGPGRPVVEIHDAVGNVVRALSCTVGGTGLATATWNREDGLGHLVPEGIYFCRYAASGVVAVRKVIVER